MIHFRRVAHRSPCTCVSGGWAHVDRCETKDDKRSSEVSFVTLALPTVLVKCVLHHISERTTKRCTSSELLEIVVPSLCFTSIENSVNTELEGACLHVEQILEAAVLLDGDVLTNDGTQIAVRVLDVHQAGALQLVIVKQDLRQKQEGSSWLQSLDVLLQERNKAARCLQMWDFSPCFFSRHMAKK